MDIGMLTCGSAGDIRPFVALGKGLHAAGHKVELCVTDIDAHDYGHFSEGPGFTIRHVATPMIKSGAELDRLGVSLVRARSLLDQASIMLNEIFLPVLDEVYEASLEIAGRSDVVIRHYWQYPAQIAAEKRVTREITLTPTLGTIPFKALAPPGFLDLGAWMNTAGWWAVRAVLNRVFLPPVNRLRAREGLAAQRDLMTDVWSARTLNLVAVSRTFCASREDWEERNRVCGFLNIPAEPSPTEPDRRFTEFLRAGERPIFVTFGSLAPRRRDRLESLLDLLEEALRQSGRRAIIQIPDIMTGLRPDGERIFFTTAIEHGRVFPQCSLIVHHGGAGTSHAALQAGAPSIVVAFIADQLLWGRELHRLGVAAKPLTIRTLAAGRLARRIRSVLADAGMARRAQEIGARMRREDGVASAVRLVEADSRLKGARNVSF